METEPEILSYYNEGNEHVRLSTRSRLEFLRTQVLLERFLPRPPSRVLDVGGGSGVYASWLAGLGYDVTLIDPVPLHIEQARSAGGFQAEPGDVRALPAADESFDAVLLLGPLYHLTDRTDRVRAFAEAARVVRPGGVVIGAAISRYASLFDGYFHDFIDLPSFPAILREDLLTGQHRNPDNVPGFFTTAYFHRSDELAAELIDGGLELNTVLPVEGPLHWAPNFQRRLDDPRQRELILAVLAQFEQDPAAVAASAHLLAVGHRSNPAGSNPAG